MHFLPANAQHIGDRHSQQDSFGFGDPLNQAFVEHGGFVAIVCDGMGGMEFGDAASRTATRAFLDAYQAKSIAESIPAALERSVHAANDAVVTLAHQYGISEGMGTTLVAAALQRSSLYYVSVGDSALFLARGGSLAMLNRPHVFANLLDAAVARGNMSREDAEMHPERESLTSFIGAESLDEVDRNAEPFLLEEGDAILLASDGLFKTLSNAEMLACLAGPPQTWPETLVGQTIAKRREHQDNVTVLSIAAEPEPNLEVILEPRAPTVRKSNTALPIPVAAVPIPTGPIPAGPVSMTTAPAPGASNSPAPVAVSPVAVKPVRGPMLIVVITILLVASATAWWFFVHQRAPKLTATPPVTDPASTTSPTPRAPGEARPPVQLDPDAPVRKQP